MSVTFEVSDVKPVAMREWDEGRCTPQPLETVVPLLLGSSERGNLKPSKLEAMGGPAMLLPTALNQKQGLFDAVHHAYDRHLPLILAPDHVWLTLAQGFSRHVTMNAKELYPQLIAGATAGEIQKQTLIVRRDEFVKGVATNDWPGVFTEFSQQIRGKTVPKTYERLMCDFSTTGPLEQAISSLTLMDTVAKYFSYEVHTLCGIPRITLTGTPEDWQKVRAKASMLAEYGLAWWTEALLPVLDQFVAAAQGYVEKHWWEGLYKENGGSGGPSFGGHINAFFPFYKRTLWNRDTQVSTTVYEPRNVVVPRDPRDTRPPRSPWARMQSSEVPPGLVTVPFIWQYHQQAFPMRFVGGLAGVTKDATGVSPAPIWAVCAGEK